MSVDPGHGPAREISSHAQLEGVTQSLAAGDHEMATRLAGEVLQRAPDDFNAWHLLGIARAQARDFEAAISYFDQALRRLPSASQVWANRARALSALGRLKEAVESFDAALAIKADRPDWWHQRGTALVELGQHAAALESYERVLVLQPLEVASISARGVALEGLGRLAEAAECYRRAIEIDPACATAYSNLGRLLRDTGETDAAISCLQKAVDYRPDFATAHNNLGCVFEDLGRLEVAIASYERALALAPGQPDFEYNLAIALLKSGRFNRGWLAFESRLRTRIWRRISPPPGLERWNGQALEGRTLVVVAEQGFGDAIQFSRYGALLNSRGIRPVLQAAPTLIELLVSTGYFQHLVPPATPFDPATHLWCPLMSLPLLFQTDETRIPSFESYVRPESSRLEKWRDRLSSVPAPRVGICWQGGSGSEIGSLRGRSMPLAELAPLALLPGISMISLQKGEAAQQLQGVAFGASIRDWSSELDTFADTAALIANLDLVVTVDTAVAHLSGALGRETWVALHCAADWRWPPERRDTPWYPTMRLFRQPQPGNWHAVMSEICRELSVRGLQV